jgi:hypothetical protein
MSPKPIFIVYARKLAPMLSIFNAKTGARYFAGNKCTIEVFLTNFQSGQKERTFIRCFAPLCHSADPKKKLEMYQAVLR